MSIVTSNGVDVSVYTEISPKAMVYKGHVKSTFSTKTSPPLSMIVIAKPVASNPSFNLEVTLTEDK